MNDLKSAIKEAGTTQTQWASTQDISSVYASNLVKGGCIVIDGVVYRPTKYTVPAPKN